MMTSSPPVVEDEHSYPLAAQIPLSNFELPAFPKEASHLRSLTLTSNINLTEYQSLLSPPAQFTLCTTLPQSITHLTLELFSLGFPNPFLSHLAWSLPNLRSITFFCCLVDGLDEASRIDAKKFFKNVPLLQEIHVIDSFTRSGFWKDVSKVFETRSDEADELRRMSTNDGHLVEQRADAGVEVAELSLDADDERQIKQQEARRSSPSAGKDRAKTLSPGVEEKVGEGALKVLEVSYTYRGYDEPDFLNRVLGEEWAGFIGGKGCVGVSLNFVSPPPQEAELAMVKEDGKKHVDADGILPFAADGRASLAIRTRFEKLGGLGIDGLADLKVLNLSMFAMTSSQVAAIVRACNRASKNEGSSGLVDLTASMLMEDGWLDTFVESLGDGNVASDLGGLEIILVPVGEFIGENAEALDQLVISEESIDALEGVCPKLVKLKINILRARRIGNVVWTKEVGKWKIQKQIESS